MAEQDIIPSIWYLVFRKCASNWRMDKQVFPARDITYLTEGSARYIINGHAYELGAGDLLCLPPNSVREGLTWPDRLMNCFSVNFELTAIDGAPASLPFPIVSHIGLRKDLINLFNELTFTWIDRQPGYVIKTRALFMLILHRLFELLVYNVDSSAGDFRVKKVIRHIARHYAEKLTVRQMAAMTGLNPVYFGALFKRETGLSMEQYLIRTRVRNAENLLRSGEYTVASIAEHCGYTDVFHFSKQFKALTGLPPSQYIPKKSARA
jgi:AraC-like DNA-binding protein